MQYRYTLVLISSLLVAINVPCPMKASATSENIPCRLKPNYSITDRLKFVMNSLAFSSSSATVLSLYDHLLVKFPNSQMRSIRQLEAIQTAATISLATPNKAATSDSFNRSEVNSLSMSTLSSTLSVGNSTVHLVALTITDSLSQIAAKVENEPLKCFADHYSGTRDAFLGDEWAFLLGDLPVMVYPFCVRTYQLGNNLGYYFNDLACSDLTGSHFIAVKKKFDLIDVDRLSVHSQNSPGYCQDQYAKRLPLHTGAQLMCWESPEAPWLRRTELIARTLRTAIDAYLAVADTSRGTRLNSTWDLASVPMDTSFFPIVPNVTIQYRCGDNIGFGKTGYGLLPFRALSSRVPPEARYIYVIADSPTRRTVHPYSSRCGTILQALFNHLTKLFPKAVVVIKRGGDQFLDYARLAYADVTICSASTFCLWPALANRGRAYFPLTPLVAKAVSNDTAPDLGPHFSWITDSSIIRDFRQFRPWVKVIKALEADGPTGATTVPPP